MKPRDKGGLCIKDLRKINISLLCKWWWKAKNGEGIWHDIIRKKYLKKGSLCFLKKSYKNSLVWNDLLKVKHIYLKGRSVRIGDGKNTRFWHDRWCGLVSLVDKFPSLYEISEDQECSVETMKQRRWKLKFRRWLHEDLQNQLGRLWDLVHCCCTNSNKDRAIWD
jgi:hypothetical protein